LSHRIFLHIKRKKNKKTWTREKITNNNKKQRGIKKMETVNNKLVAFEKMLEPEKFEKSGDAKYDWYIDIIGIFQIFIKEMKSLTPDKDHVILTPMDFDPNTMPVNFTLVSVEKLIEMISKNADKIKETKIIEFLYRRQPGPIGAVCEKEVDLGYDLSSLKPFHELKAKDLPRDEQCDQHNYEQSLHLYKNEYQVLLSFRLYINSHTDMSTYKPTQRQSFKDNISVIEDNILVNLTKRKWYAMADEFAKVRDAFLVLENNRQVPKIPQPKQAVAATASPKTATTVVKHKPMPSKEKDIKETAMDEEILSSSPIPAIHEITAAKEKSETERLLGYDSSESESSDEFEVPPPNKNLTGTKFPSLASVAVDAKPRQLPQEKTATASVRPTPYDRGHASQKKLTTKKK
jgi:hypothetical protein